MRGKQTCLLMKMYLHLCVYISLAFLCQWARKDEQVMAPALKKLLVFLVGSKNDKTPTESLIHKSESAACYNKNSSRVCWGGREEAKVSARWRDWRKTAHPNWIWVVWGNWWNFSGQRLIAEHCYIEGFFPIFQCGRHCTRFSPWTFSFVMCLFTWSTARFGCLFCWWDCS
jgi:hypothetical protein